jgi:serine/threonine-protein kinase HipA
LPDGWGDLILDRYLRQKGINSGQLTLLEKLSLIGTTGRGALEFFPDHSVHEENISLDFNKLASESQKILTNEYAGDSIETLYQYSGSSGGARPKVFVTIDNKHWLIKFKATIDPPEIGRIEYDYSLLAKRCGINMPETRLFGNRYFAVERFDRKPVGKVHTISVAGLLNADYRIPSLDYSALLKVCLHLTRNMEEVYSLFRLMIFNIVISNRDDHAKNFSFQYKNGIWILSPAYDILPSRGFNGYHTTTVNGQGEPKMNDILQVASEVSLSKNRINEIMEQVINICRSENKLNYSI